MKLTGICAFFLILFCNIAHQREGAQDSCSHRCGEELVNCSCQRACKSLGICCSDYSEFCLQISPSSGSLMGGKDFEILNVTFNASSAVSCRFKQEIETNGYVAEDGRAHCISPLLYESGLIPFEISRDGGLTFPHSATWLSVHHSKVSAAEKSTLVNATKWQYYGTPNTGGNLTVTWMHQTFPARRVNIEVWGYQETGESYSENWMAEWKYLYTLGKEEPNSGTFTFIPVPVKADYSTWDIGALRISPSNYSDGKSNVPSIWSPVHALAWHLGEDFRKDSASWATAKCLEWDRREETLPDFLEEIMDCPCTLAQARADTGRFHTDYGCDIEKGSVCTYHPGAVHCVRAIQASPQYASGQQCCYDSTGTQILTRDSIGGSTPDRGHDWGSPPFKKPPRIPGFSHWLYDVISFYYCCLWSENCQFYLKHRPSSDCKTYKPPRVASAFGDPHFLTFDGANITFKGQGEYTLLESSLTTLRVQGRTQPARSLNSLFLYSTADQNIIVMFSSGAGMELRGRGGFLSLTVLLPVEFHNHTQGILGVMNDNPRDEYTFKNGTTMSSDASPQQLFEFGADWAVKYETSLFTYDTQFLLNNFFYATKHNSAFIPVFSPYEDPADLLVKEMTLLCDSDPFCRFDVLTTRSLKVGNSTRVSHRNHKWLVESLQPVVSCGWLDHPTNGKKEGTNYLLDSTIRFSCNQGYRLAGSEERTCQLTGVWSGGTTSCLPGTASHPCSEWGNTLFRLNTAFLTTLRDGEVFNEDTSAQHTCTSAQGAECYTANGADYRGTQNQTSLHAGRPCLFWNETFQHPYNTLKYPNGEGGLGEHNYCRNPDGDVSPWCYIAECEDGVYWKYCEIPSCRMPGNLGCYKDYGDPPLTGISETSNKLTIQTCISFCRNQQFKFAGMESGYACFCGNNPDYWRYGEAVSTECNSVCFGDHTQPCGGDGRVILFDTLLGSCGGNYTSPTSVIYSPDFPDTYATGRVCYWTIQIPGASQIEFNFTLFDIKDSTDMVEVLDGYTYHVLARFDGRNRPPISFNVSLDFVILYFFSDQINQAQGFAVVYRAIKEKLHQDITTVNQIFTEVITDQANLRINAAQSSKILYVITTSPSHPPSSMSEWSVYGLTALLIITVSAILAKILLHFIMKSHQAPSSAEIGDSHQATTAGEIWSIFYKPSTSISIFKKKFKSQQDDCSLLVGH
ncbi:kremen protein 1 isoform X4 [Dermochelys coriacea]|uniref:kremen protein 1 isoform X4 n=1 Tax=Dermochelys coriacea TaxID=27794 RepID=UPI001CA97263|nr:kremen protein 1 isoform X4 [Dermochelys coriacea]